MSLYQINQTIMDIISTMEEIAESDLPDLEKQDRIGQLSVAYHKKIEDLEKECLQIAKAIKNEVAVADMIQNEVRSLQERKKQHQNKAKYLKKLLNNIITPEDKFEDSQARISWRKSKSVWFDEEHITSLPPETLKIETKVSKTELRKWLEINGDTAIAKIEEKNNLQIK